MKTTLDIPDTIYRQFKTPPPPSISTSLPPWLGCAAKFARTNLDGPHDMSSVRASIAKKRFAKGIAQ